MIRLRMSAADLERTRFAYSPLAEVAESIYVLSSQRVPPVHTGWFRAVSGQLKRVDMALLHAVVPAHPTMASFLFAGAVDPSTTIDSQLRLLLDSPPEQIRADLEHAWRDRPFPPVLDRLLADGPAGVRRLGGTLWKYWTLAIEPYWKQIRAVLDDDVAYRANRLTYGGMTALFSDLHPKLTVADQELRIGRNDHKIDEHLAGTGLVLTPSVFAWPNLAVITRGMAQPTLAYASRSVGNLWEVEHIPSHDTALGSLIGHSRAAILLALRLPRSTTELAAQLNQSAPSVNQHLSVLRRSGLVTSWRSGRRVLYQRTPLGDSIISANLS